MIALRVYEAGRKILDGDDSVSAARHLEMVLWDEYPGDERIDDLLEVVALYAPGMGLPYTDISDLRRAIDEAFVMLSGK